MYTLKVERKYEITQWEGMALLRSMTFAFVMISIVVVDMTVIIDDAGNAWVMRFWKNGMMIFNATALLDVAFVLPATILSVMSMIVQLLKASKKSKSEILYNTFSNDFTDLVYVKSNVKRLRCVDTDQGRICKVLGTMDGTEFRSS